MPKLKTRKAAAKRFKKTAGGKLRRAHAFRSHLLTNRRRKRKRRLRRKDTVSRADQDRIEQGMPY